MRRCLFFLFIALFASSWLAGQQWPQWRGPQRSGVARDIKLPDKWPATLLRLWRVEVGDGHSSPLVAEKRTYIHTRRGEEEVVTALSLDEGTLLWESQAYVVPYRMNSAASRHGKGPKSTPALADGRLFTLSITGVLSALSADTGKLLWRRDFSEEFSKTAPTYGTATSPLVEQGRVIAHVGGAGQGALRAFDASSGATLWSWEGDGPGYASPVLLKTEEGHQLITQTEQKIVGIDFDQGKLLWEIPFTTPYSQNIVTPLVLGPDSGVLLSGLQAETFLLRPRHSGGSWIPETVWRNSRLAMYMSSPVQKGSLLLGMAHQRGGVFFCLEADTGDVLWTSPGREGENASLILTGDLVFILTDAAKLLVVSAPADGFTPIAEYTVSDSPTWAHPAIVGDLILIKDKTSLTAWSWAQK